MSKKPVVIIELEPTEYTADIKAKRKREPFFGSGAVEWGAFVLSWAIVASGVHWVKYLLH